MRVLLLLPSLIAGAVMALSGGYWQGLIFVGASLLVQLVMLLVNRPPTVTEGSIVQVVGKTAFLDGRRMPNRLSRWPPTARRLLFDYLRQSQVQSLGSTYRRASPPTPAHSLSLGSIARIRNLSSS